LLSSFLQRPCLLLVLSMVLLLVLQKSECDRFGNPLFESKGTKKHWNIVQLVAKKGSDVKLVTSKDAIRAVCLLCQKHITYTKGNGNSVYRHVEKYHKTELGELDFIRKELGK
jgi:predicted Fe-Mo cluster-binding NifX family protein